MATVSHDIADRGPSSDPSPSSLAPQTSLTHPIFSGTHAYFLPSVPSLGLDTWTSLGGLTLHIFPIHTTVSCSDPSAPLAHLLALAHGRKTLIFGASDADDAVPAQFRVIDWRWIQACERGSAEVSMEGWTLRDPEEDECDVEDVEVMIANVAEEDEGNATAPAGLLRSPTSRSGTGRFAGTGHTTPRAGLGAESSATPASTSPSNIEEARTAAYEHEANACTRFDSPEVTRRVASSSRTPTDDRRAIPGPERSTPVPGSPWARESSSSTPKALLDNSRFDSRHASGHRPLLDDKDETPRPDKARKLSSDSRIGARNMLRCRITPRIDLETLSDRGGEEADEFDEPLPYQAPARQALSHIHPNSRQSASTWHSGAPSHGKSLDLATSARLGRRGPYDTPTPHSRVAHALAHHRTPALSPTNFGNALPTREIELSVVMPVLVAKATHGPLYEQRLALIERAKADLAPKVGAHSGMIYLGGLNENERHDAIQAEAIRVAEDVVRSVEDGMLDNREGRRGLSGRGGMPIGIGGGVFNSQAPSEWGTELSSVGGSEAGSSCGSQVMRCAGGGPKWDDTRTGGMVEGSQSRGKVESGPGKRSKAMLSRRKLGAGRSHGNGTVRSSARIAQRREREAEGRVMVKAAVAGEAGERSRAAAAVANRGFESAYGLGERSSIEPTAGSVEVPGTGVPTKSLHQ